MKFWLVRIASILAVIVGGFALNAALVNLQTEFPYRIAVLAGLYVVLAVSLNLINGITGQFSVGHAAFYMVGAYTCGMLAKTVMPAFVSAIPFGTNDIKTGIWLITMMIVGALAAAGAGFIVGLPSLRLKGDYLAIVTLGFGEILRIVAQNIMYDSGAIKVVEGPYGIQSVPKLFNLWLVFILAAFSVAICRNLLKTAHGLPFLAVREDEVASSAMGVDVTRVKVTAFVIGAALAGAAGALLMHYETYVSPSSFKMEVSFLVLTMVVLGGTGSITGSVIGAILLFGIPEYLRTVQDSSGDSLKVTAGVILAYCFVIVAMTALLRREQSHFHGNTNQRRTRTTMILVGSLVAAQVLGIVLNLVPALNEKWWTFTDLRWAILAIVLIVIMLLRPQGILAHHELSLDRLLNRLEGKKQGATA